MRGGPGGGGPGNDDPGGMRGLLAKTGHKKHGKGGPHGGMPCNLPPASPLHGGPHNGPKFGALPPGPRGDASGVMPSTPAVARWPSLCCLARIFDSKV